MPKNPDTHIQKTAPAPPAEMAAATPTMFPVPMAAANAAEHVFHCLCTVFPTEQSAERLSENHTDSKNLKKMRANTEKQSCSQQQDQQSAAPNPCIQLFQHRAVLRIFIKSTDLS